LGDRLGEANILNNLGDVWLAMERPQAALIVHSQALASREASRIA